MKEREFWFTVALGDYSSVKVQVFAESYHLALHQLFEELLPFKEEPGIEDFLRRMMFKPIREARRNG